MVACAPHATPVVYHRRQPEKTMLYQAVSEHLPAFLAACDAAERPVPKFVRREFEAFLDCGILDKGAVRVRCPTCGLDLSPNGRILKAICIIAIFFQRRSVGAAPTDFAFG